MSRQFQQKYINARGSTWPVLIVVVAIVIVIIAIALSLGQRRRSDRQPAVQVVPVESRVAEPQLPGRMYLTQVGGSRLVRTGEAFRVETRLDTMSANISLAQVVVNYDAKALEYVDFDDNNSVMSIKARDDSRLGQVNIIRGAPGDGDSKDSDDGFTGDGLFGILTFRPLLAGSTRLLLDSGEVKLLLDDGQGTPLKVEVNEVDIEIVP